jgi:hypothetical protein
MLLLELAVLISLSGLAHSETADHTLLAARRFVARWLDELPDIACLQTTERFTLDRRQMWHREEFSKAELTIEQGEERYQLLSVNGKPPRDATPAVARLQGSSGEFLSAVRRLFDSASKAEFRRRGTREERGRILRRYDFRILQANSQWYVGADPGYRPAYSGTVWVDVDDGGLSRIDMEAHAFPARLAIRLATIQTEFESVALDGAPHLMPIRSEVVVFANWGYAERRLIKYSNYRQFAAASRIVSEHPERKMIAPAT